MKQKLYIDINCFLTINFTKRKERSYIHNPFLNNPTHFETVSVQWTIHLPPAWIIPTYRVVPLSAGEATVASYVGLHTLVECIHFRYKTMSIKCRYLKYQK